MLFPVSWHRNTSTDVEKTQSHHHQLGRRKETPPRTWRRLDRNTVGSQAAGNTSTDVEKTKLSTENLPLKTKHLHGRGEDQGTTSNLPNRSETPPRTWRRRKRGRNRHNRAGNTSTDVEKTLRPKPQPRCLQKHLHGRGEDLPPGTLVTHAEETPPRTWRRLKTTGTEPPRLRNTSTDVEKTENQRHPCSRLRKHLHGRGEDTLIIRLGLSPVETPPRTWRRHSEPSGLRLRLRNTSTDVEKTLA